MQLQNGSERNQTSALATLPWKQKRLSSVFAPSNTEITASESASQKVLKTCELSLSVVCGVSSIRDHVVTHGQKQAPGTGRALQNVPPE